MDFRRIIAFGKSSHVVSLPKGWLDENKLKKGDLVYLEQDFDKLIITPKEKSEETEDKRTIINIDGKNINRVKREISSAFINYNDYIIIQGKELPEYLQDVTKAIHNLIALEIMEQSSDKLTARDFLKVGDIKVKDYFKKEDIIIRSMLTDLKNPNFKNYEELIERQEHVKRIYLLLLKVFKAVSKDVTLIKKMDLNMENLLKYYKLNFSMQSIAHSLKIISQKLMDVKNSKQKKDITQLIDRLDKHFIEVMKTFYSENIGRAYSLADTRDSNSKDIRNLLKHKNVDLGIISERIMWIYAEIHHILHRVYS